MRLLEFDSRGDLRFTKNFDENIPPYAILSHTWGADDEEVTFKDLECGSSDVKVKLGYRKLLFCGERAKRDGLGYFWVDTCCIDKANHTELSEAITSMFRWYRDSVVCYVYLSDVSVGICDKNDEIKETWDSAFRSSRWFTRGWTLQELIAPRSVEFFSLEGELLGNKEVLEQQIQEVTGLPIAALRGASLSDFSVDERLRWAENRQTRKEEDKAYCLLGIFNVFMPLIYGEGENAFIRLKEVIERSSRKTTLSLAKLDEATNKSLDESRLAVLGGLDGQVPGLITRLATEFVKEVQNHTPNLAVQMQEAFRTQEKELTNQWLDSLQHITRTVDVASPHSTKLSRSRLLKQQKSPTGALRRNRGNIQRTFTNRQKSKGQDTSSVFQQNLCNPAAWQRGIDSWLTIIFLASGTAFASPTVNRTLHRFRASAHDDPVLALMAFVVALYILRFCHQLPARISLLSDSSVSFEDAFGSRLAIPFLQCSDFEIFRGFLEVHYKHHRPGLQHVLHKQYLILLEASQSRVIDPERWSQVVKPRSRLTMFMVMMSGKYTCPKCQGALDNTELLRASCQSCDEHYMIAGTQALAEGSSLEELQDEQEDEDEITTEDGAQNEDSDEDDVKQNSNNVTATWKPDVTYRKNAINRVAEVDRIQSTFKHMALSQSKKRRSFEDAEMIFESYHYPDGMYPIRKRVTRQPTMLRHLGDLEHYRLEKIDYDWTETSRTKLNTSEGKLLSLMNTSTSNQLLKGFRRMSRDRRAEIYRLLNVKNAAEQQGGVLWHVAHMKIIKSRTKSYGNGPPRVEVFCMEIVIDRVVASSAFLFLQCLNGTFEAKQITLPFYPEVLRIGRQTNSRTAPTPENGYFNSKAVSRQHADIWADLSGRVFIRDVKSSNGTYVNDLRLSPEKCESEPHELRLGDKLELGYNIESEDQKTVVHYKIFAIVDFVGFLGLRTS